MIISYLKHFSGSQHVTAFFIVCIFVGIELFLRKLKSRKKKEFDSKKATAESLAEIEEISLEHYRQFQHIDVVRFVIIVIGLVSVLSAYNIQAFNIIAVATGAFILALRESFTSLVAYFYILSSFKLGDDIRVSTFLGEIVRVKPLYTAIAGKEENGEYNGSLHHIPNFMFLNQIIEQQQNKSDDYLKVALQLLYTKKSFNVSFDEFISSIESHLDELLPKRPMNKVGYFKGYAGVRYKLSFDYNDKGDVVIKLSFITRSSKRLELKESIIRYVENLRVHDEKIEDKA